LKELINTLTSLISHIETGCPVSEDNMDNDQDINFCPECKEKYVATCKCRINERTCANGHSWYMEDGMKISGTKHGRVK